MPSDPSGIRSELHAAAGLPAARGWFPAGAVRRIPTARHLLAGAGRNGAGVLNVGGWAAEPAGAQVERRAAGRRIPRSYPGTSAAPRPHLEHLFEGEAPLVVALLAEEDQDRLLVAAAAHAGDRAARHLLLVAVGVDGRVGVRLAPVRIIGIVRLLSSGIVRIRLPRLGLQARLGDQRLAFVLEDRLHLAVGHRVLPQPPDGPRLDLHQLFEADRQALEAVLEDADRLHVLPAARDQLLFPVPLDLLAPH